MLRLLLSVGAKHSTCEVAACRRARGGWISLAATLAVTALPVAAADITTLSIEQLLEVKVVTASRYEQRVSEVAGAPQVMSADEIRASGARTVADILAMFGGVHLQFDGIYSRVGVRGFLRPGDFNARILLLVNGHRANEIVYDGAMLGEEGVLDVSLIERVEYLPGPGSSIYGSNALSGVINLITRKASDHPDTWVRVEGTDPQATRLEAGVSVAWGQGASGVLQVSRFDRRGRFHEAEELGGAIAAGTKAGGRDKEWANRVFAQVEAGDFSFNFLHFNRQINLANGAFLTSPAIADQPSRDRESLLDMSHRRALSSTVSLSSHLGFREYRNYTNNYFAGPTVTMPVNTLYDIRARWIDADVRIVAQWHPDSTLVAGVETTRAESVDFISEDRSTQIRTVNRSDAFARWGVFAQNDWRAVPWLTLSAGARTDGQSGRDRVASPRAGLVARPDEATSIKAQFGRAFRNPNTSELAYLNPVLGYKTDPRLKREDVDSAEFTVEREYGGGLSWRASVFRNRFDNLIDLEFDPSEDLLIFRNLGSATIKGVQADVLWRTIGGWRARAGATWQRSRSIEMGVVTDLRYSPRRLANLSLFTPRWKGWMGSVVVQYSGPQWGRLVHFGGHAVAHTSIVYDTSRWSVHLGARNVFDRRFSYPLGDDFIQQGQRAPRRQVTLGLGVSF